MAAAARDLALRLGSVSHATWCNLFAATGAATFPVLFFVSAPYGKAFRRGWGTPLSGRWGWAVQEVISPVVLLFCWYTARLSEPLFAPVPVHVFLFLWCLHYANRAVLYPLQRHMNNTTLPVVLSAVAFNLVNGALVGTELATRTAEQLPGWWDLTRPRVVAGLLLMAFGAWLNISSDARLRALRARVPGDRSYHIPAGGLFTHCCCPHYLGEILEWTGFAIATATRSGYVFAFWTFANLAPRAWTTRQWYRAKFKDRFPASTKALVPFVF